MKKLRLRVCLRVSVNVLVMEGANDEDEHEAGTKAGAKDAVE